MSARTKLDHFRPRPRWIRYLATYVSLFLGSLLTRTKIKNRHHLPKNGPYILAINHFSVVDPLFVIFSTMRPINFLAASDQTIDWFNYWAVWLYGFIPTNRTQFAPSTIKSSKRVLKNKDILGIFPEGTTTSNILRPAKKGVVYLSTMMNVSVVPIGVAGLENVWTQWLKGVRPKVTVKIGKPFGPFAIEQGANKDEAISNIGYEVMCQIAALLPKKYRGVFSNETRVKQIEEELVGSG